MSTYPEMIAQRVMKQSKVINVHPAVLLMQEILDMNHAYMLSLKLILKESEDDNCAGRGMPD